MFVDKQTPQEVNKTLAYSITLMFKNLDPLDQELMTFPTSTAKFVQIQIRAAQYQYFLIDPISIILLAFLSISIPLSIIFNRADQYQYCINYSKSFLINFNINIPYQYLLLILLRLPISYQLVIVINTNIVIN